MKQLKNLLVFLNIVKHNGKDSKGEFITSGLNKKNIFSYVLLFIACLVSGLCAFVEEFIDLWKYSWHKK